jgi:hypothetical protein
MPAAGAYVVVDGQTYHVLDKPLDDVHAAVADALEKGSVLSLNVVAEHGRGTDQGSGTLFLHGRQLSSVGVFSGPLPATGHATGF